VLLFLSLILWLPSWRNKDLYYSVRKFYTAANTIYIRNKFCSEFSKLFLIETFCLPLITVISYGCECVNHDGKKLCQLNVCWNNVYRKVFRMHVWESVKELQFLCKRLDFRHICTLKKFLFLHKLFRLDNEVLKTCYFRIASLQNLSLCVMILILQLTYVLYKTFDVKYLIILVV